MAYEKAPAFQLYPADFLSDAKAMALTNEQFGIYCKLLMFCWREGSLPTDVGCLARICGDRRHKPVQTVCTLFEPRDGRLYHPRLEQEREKQRAFRELQAARGRKGGLAGRGRPKAGAKPARVLSSSVFSLRSSD